NLIPARDNRERGRDNRERACSSKIVELPVPARKIPGRLVESLLAATIADEIGGASAGEDVRAVSDYRTCLDDVERHWRQYQVASGTLLPYVAILDAPCSV